MNSACLTTRNNLINKFTISLFNYPWGKCTLSAMVMHYVDSL
jgi:hypothetical protein